MKFETDRTKHASPPAPLTDFCAALSWRGVPFALRNVDAC